jgi:hypothetical protein
MVATPLERSLGREMVRLSVSKRARNGSSFMVPALLAVGLAAGCTKNPARDSAPDPRGWLIESYENRVITVQHEGNTYKAMCDVSRSFHNAESITDPNNVHEYSDCELAIELVGHNVQPFEGKKKDAQGWTTNMWNVGSTLALRRWRDERTPWRQEEFRITSVVRKP